MVNRYLCQYCEKHFYGPSNLRRHIISIHKKIPEYKKKGQKCTACGEDFLTREAFRLHVQEVHKIELKSQCHQFSNNEDFEKWLRNEENQNCCAFVKINRRFGASGDLKQIYACNREGTNKTYLTDNRVRHRKEKKQGSCKIGGSCTAGIALTRNNSGCHVLYYPTHFGHKMELDHLRIPPDVREKLKEKLRQNVPHEKIIEEIQNDARNGEKISRVHLAKRKDLRNISAREGIKIKKQKNVVQEDNLVVDDICTNQSFESETSDDRKKEQLENRLSRALDEFESIRKNSLNVLNISALSEICTKLEVFVAEAKQISKKSVDNSTKHVEEESSDIKIVSCYSVAEVTPDSIEFEKMEPNLPTEIKINSKSKNKSKPEIKVLPNSSKKIKPNKRCKKLVSTTNNKTRKLNLAEANQNFKNESDQPIVDWDQFLSEETVYASVFGLELS